jgi:hypothetical protein
MEADIKKLDWLVEALASFARAEHITRKQAFDFALEYGGFDFINRHYDVEHQLPLEDVVEDIELVSARNGGYL